MKASTKKNLKKLSIAAAAIMFAAAVIAAGEACFAFEEKSSADFQWKYEMDVLPSMQDLDGIGGADFGLYGGGTVEDGVLTMPVNCFLEAPGSGLWQNQISFSEGWTIEARVKVLEQTQGYWSWQIFAAAPGGSSTASLSIAAAGQGWLSGSSLGNNDNTDGFHVFRVVQPANSETFTIWRDGELLGTADDVYNYGNSLWFGDGGSDYSGVTEVDYFRFTSGAYAPTPIPEPGMFTLLGLAALGLFVLCRR